MLAPEAPAVDFLRDADEAQDISVEDLKELFYISYEMAAHRFTNLATEHLGIPCHFLRTDSEGVIDKAYENDGFPFPRAADGGLEGEPLTRLSRRLICLGVRPDSEASTVADNPNPRPT